MTEVATTAGRYAADFRVLQEREAPGWLHDLRQRAFERFEALGFPTARKSNEPWKYTNVAPMAEVEFSHAAPSSGLGFSLTSEAPWAPGMPAAVFVNGRFSAELSTGLDGAVHSLAEAIRIDAGLVQEHLARYAPFENQAFSALNTAFIEDGAFIDLGREQTTAGPLNLIYVTVPASREPATYPRTLVVADPLSEATIIETYLTLGEGRHFTNAVTEFALMDGAHVRHYRLLLESKRAYHVGATAVHQGRDSSFTSVAYEAGAGLARSEYRVLLDAEGTSARLNGLYITTGTQHMDNSVNIDHAKPHGTSRMFYKGILDERSKAVFGGTVFVRAGADKTDAHQEDKNLLLSDEAEVDSKPSLEIYADDVKAGHGATAGAPTEDVLFYIQSRGIDPDTSMRLFVKGFAAEILDTVHVEPLRAYLEERTLRALPRFAEAAS